jgi:large subunit ribosomal protein L25
MAIVHPKGENELITAKLAEVKKALHETPGVGIMQVQADKEEVRTVLIKHVDFEPVTRAIINMTLTEVHKGDSIRLSVPITPTGSCKAEEYGEAVMMRPNHHIRVEAKIGAVPDNLHVDISNLEVGGSITVGDIVFPEGTTVLSPPDEVLFFLKAAAKIVEEPTPSTETESAETSTTETN